MDKASKTHKSRSDKREHLIRVNIENMKETKNEKITDDLLHYIIKGNERNIIAILNQNIELFTTPIRGKFPLEICALFGRYNVLEKYLYFRGNGLYKRKNSYELHPVTCLHNRQDMMMTVVCELKNPKKDLSVNDINNIIHALEYTSRNKLLNYFESKNMHAKIQEAFDECPCIFSEEFVHSMLENKSYDHLQVLDTFVFSRFHNRASTTWVVSIIKPFIDQIPSDKILRYLSLSILNPVNSFDFFEKKDLVKAMGLQIHHFFPEDIQNFISLDLVEIMIILGYRFSENLAKMYVEEQLYSIQTTRRRDSSVRSITELIVMYDLPLKLNLSYVSPRNIIRFSGITTYFKFFSKLVGASEITTHPDYICIHLGIQSLPINLVEKIFFMICPRFLRTLSVSSSSILELQKVFCGYDFSTLTSYCSSL